MAGMGWLTPKARQSGRRTAFWRDSNVRFWCEAVRKVHNKNYALSER